MSISLTVCAGGVYAVCESWWRRRRRPVPERPSPYLYAAARLAERDMLAAAEEIVDAAYARLAGLYEMHEVHEAHKAGHAYGVAPVEATGTGHGPDTASRAR
ncbi:hypothetical protein [Streptomyces sp. NPDC000410]|uniref:hypothetical protein n=1 Tax=Streptomyces sp. NPDC000410 TaxID=3154254 RepID=UPI003316C109